MALWEDIVLIGNLYPPIRVEGVPHQKSQLLGQDWTSFHRCDSYLSSVGLRLSRV